MNAMYNSAGLTMENYIKHIHTTQFQFKLLKQNMIAAAISMGKEFLPVIKMFIGMGYQLLHMLGSIGKAFLWLTKHIGGVTNAFKALLVILSSATVGAIYLGFIAKLQLLAASARQAAWALLSEARAAREAGDAVAQSSLVAQAATLRMSAVRMATWASRILGPWGMLITIVATLAGNIWMWWKASKASTEATNIQKDAVDQLNESIEKEIKNYEEGIKGLELVRDKLGSNTKVTSSLTEKLRSLKDNLPIDTVKELADAFKDSSNKGKKLGEVTENIIEKFKKLRREKRLEKYETELSTLEKEKGILEDIRKLEDKRKGLVDNINDLENKINNSIGVAIYDERLNSLRKEESKLLKQKEDLDAQIKDLKTSISLYYKIGLFWSEERKYAAEAKAVSNRRKEIESKIKNITKDIKDLIVESSSALKDSAQSLDFMLSRIDYIKSSSRDMKITYGKLPKDIESFATEMRSILDIHKGLKKQLDDYIKGIDDAKDKSEKQKRIAALINVLQKHRNRLSDKWKDKLDKSKLTLKDIKGITDSILDNTKLTSDEFDKFAKKRFGEMEPSFEKSISSMKDVKKEIKGFEEKLNEVKTTARNVGVDTSEIIRGMLKNIKKDIEKHSETLEDLETKWLKYIREPSVETKKIFIDALKKYYEFEKESGLIVDSLSRLPDKAISVLSKIRSELGESYKDFSKYAKAIRDMIDKSVLGSLDNVLKNKIVFTRAIKDVYDYFNKLSSEQLTTNFETNEKLLEGLAKFNETYKVLTVDERLKLAEKFANAKRAILKKELDEEVKQGELTKDVEKEQLRERLGNWIEHSTALKELLGKDFEEFKKNILDSIDVVDTSLYTLEQRAKNRLEQLRNNLAKTFGPDLAEIITNAIQNLADTVTSIFKTILINGKITTKELHDIWNRFITDLIDVMLKKAENAILASLSVGGGGNKGGRNWLSSLITSVIGFFTGGRVRTSTGGYSAPPTPVAVQSGGEVRSSGPTPAILHPGEIVMPKNVSDIFKKIASPSMVSVPPAPTQTQGGSLVLISAVDAKSFRDMILQNRGVIHEINADDLKRNGILRSVIERYTR